MASKVFDFSDSGEEEKKKTGDKQEIKGPNTGFAVTYSTFSSDADDPSPEHPILVLKDQDKRLVHHVSGIFGNPHRRTTFVCGKHANDYITDIKLMDSRFVSLLIWLGEKEKPVRLSGRQTDRGFAVYHIHCVDSSGRNLLTSDDGFVQLVIDRLYSSPAPEELSPEELMEQQDEDTDEDMMLTDLGAISDFLDCAGSILPENIRRWAHRNINLVRSSAISADEKRHAKRALSMMMNIKWKSAYFEDIDPVKARAILDEELYGMEGVKQRIIETIIQINRTHTLPAYGLLLAGPAGVGKSQVAYAVARILKLPWTSLDMSTIHDPEALTGSPRVYSNAKPGRIMEAFSQAGTSNLVFIINELDKADAGDNGGNPADALLTLLDNLGYTDNYIECTIPTTGVYPIATANDKEKISKPLMTRFAVIDIPDYTPEEKKTIFLEFSLPRVLQRMNMSPEECVVTDEGAQAVVEKYAAQPGCRDLEQAAEHLAAHALYRIETEGVTSVTYDGETTRKTLG